MQTPLSVPNGYGLATKWSEANRDYAQSKLNKQRNRIVM